MPAATACRPTSSYKSWSEVVAGADFEAALGEAAAAGLEGACLVAAGLACAAGAVPPDAVPPGILTGFWQPGHFTVLPASSSLAAKALPQVHCTLIGMTEERRAR